MRIHKDVDGFAKTNASVSQDNLAGGHTVYKNPSGQLVVDQQAILPFKSSPQHHTKSTSRTIRTVIKMKFTLLPVLSLAAMVLAAPADLEPRAGGAPCGVNNAGTLSCCNQLAASSSLPAAVQGLIAVALGSIPINVGLQCNPIIGILNANNCQKTQVCCNTQGTPQVNNGINILNGLTIPVCPAIPIQL